MDLRDDFYIPTNEFQTEITKDFLSSLPDEVAEQLLDFVQNVEYIKNLISPTRRRAKDMPRDDQGRIIVDLENPHILENMDYFRPAALHYKEFNCYTFLRPNPNPNSEYRKWIDEEKRRCREGYVRESDDIQFSDSLSTRVESEGINFSSTTNNEIENDSINFSSTVNNEIENNSINFSISSSERTNESDSINFSSTTDNEIENDRGSGRKSFF